MLRRILLAGSLGGVAVISVVAGCSDTSAPLAAPGLHVVGGAPTMDTISAIISEPLTVLVVDSAGSPAAGRIVQFDAVRAEPESQGDYWESMSVAPAGGNASFSARIAVTTDKNGFAGARIRLQTTAGPGAVAIRVPSLNYADTARYTVTVGNGYKVIVTPADTAAYVGHGYVLHGHVVDRGGNIRLNDAVTFAVDSGPATIDRTTGALTPTALGRVKIHAQSGALLQAAWLSVVPPAWVAAQQHYPGNGGPIGVFYMQLDGSGREALAAGIDNAFVSGQGFGWSPDGRDLVLARGDSIDLVSPGSSERRLIDAGGPVFTGARFSRDGEWVYFARPGAGLFRAHRDGTGVQHMGRGGTEWGEDYRPAPSDDGRSVVYGSYRTPCGVEDCIRVLDIATDSDRTYPGGRDFLVRGYNAAWSPNEDLIAYASGTSVGLIHSDGTGQRVLANVGHVGWMDFSPDGKWLLVSPGAGPVLLFNVATGTWMPIPTLGTYGATAWQP